jgi:hypothetical protein
VVPEKTVRKYHGDDAKKIKEDAQTKSTATNNTGSTTNRTPQTASNNATPTTKTDQIQQNKTNTSNNGKRGKGPQYSSYYSYEKIPIYKKTTKMVPNPENESSWQQIASAVGLGNDVGMSPLSVANTLSKDVKNVVDGFVKKSGILGSVLTGGPAAYNIINDLMSDKKVSNKDIKNAIFGGAELFITIAFPEVKALQLVATGGGIMNDVYDYMTEPSKPKYIKITQVKLVGYRIAKTKHVIKNY